MMEKTKQNSGKKRKRMTPFSKFLCIVGIVAACFLSWQACKEVYTTFTLKRQLAEVEEQLRKVQDENAYLTSEKEKLQDPDYVASYARGNYLLSKNDEQIFYLPENADK
ncbi:MAG: FtsB family cell division protein [Bulleidia sp.]